MIADGIKPMKNKMSFTIVAKVKYSRVIKSEIKITEAVIQLARVVYKLFRFL